MEQTFTANDRIYEVPSEPVLAVCVDGWDPEYVADALGRGLMPRVAELTAAGAHMVGRAQVPTFTNPNNVAIVTGVCAARNGIAGNHYRDRDGHEVQVTDPSFLRAGTIHAAAQAAGVPALCVTAKDKLRRLLADGDVGSLAWIHLDDLDELDRARGVLASLPGVEGVFDRWAAAESLELPADRIGDLVVLAGARTVLGKSEAAHDLSQLNGRLRSHGGLHDACCSTTWRERVAHRRRPPGVRVRRRRAIRARRRRTSMIVPEPATAATASNANESRRGGPPPVLDPADTAPIGCPAAAASFGRAAAAA